VLTHYHEGKSSRDAGARPLSLSLAPNLSRPPSNNCTEEMNMDIGWWAPVQRQFDANWSHPHQTPKARTSVVTRTRVARHGSQPNPTTQRPSSSGGENILIPYRRHCGTQRRSESYSHPTPLDEFRTSRIWPPSGYRQDEVLSPQDAEDLISAGSSTFKGYWDAIPNAPQGYNRFYAVMDSEHQSRTDRASFQQHAFRDLSLNMTGAADSQFPWLSLEQPCMAYAFGKSAGTTTLNYWISKSGSGNPPTKFPGETKPRKLNLLQILDRLQHLENGLDEDVSSQPFL
jgi:hypothetical protein